MITILGAGAIGTAFAVHLVKNGKPVRLWGTKYDENNINEMINERRCKILNVNIPSNLDIFYENELEKAVNESQLILFAVSSKGIIPVSKMVAPYLTGKEIVLSVVKGLHVNNNFTLLSLIKEYIPVTIRDKIAYVKIGGPIKANVLADKSYAHGIFACRDLDIARKCRDLFKSHNFVCEVTDDIIGVEICSALKNSYSIVIGLYEGYLPGIYSTSAAVMSGVIQELRKLTNVCSGKEETVFGLAGIGDLYLTVLSGRNVTFGKLIGKYGDVESARIEMQNATVEGSDTCFEGMKLVSKLEKSGAIERAKDVPFLNGLHEILFEKKDVQETLKSMWETWT